jgi:hypothetical protein
MKIENKEIAQCFACRFSLENWILSLMIANSKVELTRGRSKTCYQEIIVRVGLDKPWLKSENPKQLA